MLNDILLGQYIPGKSLPHRMNAALKIVLTLIYLIMLFVIKNPVSYVVFTAYTAALIFIAEIPFKTAAAGIKPLKWILIFMAVFNLFGAQGDAALFFAHLWKIPIAVSYESVYLTITVILRLILLVTSASVLTLTTSPLDMTDGLETLLKPFERLKLPASDIAMMVSIALRFIPALAEEADKIMKAQTARGADFSSGGIIRRAKAMLPVLIPLFVNAFRRADELALAMESRCYVGGKRTKMKETKITRADITAAAVFAAAMAAGAAIEFLIEI